LSFSTDNEWNDCPNIKSAYGYWQQEFVGFERYWNHTFNIVRPQSRPENFYFVHKHILFIGLNLVGGHVHDQTEWVTRLTEQASWTIELMEYHTSRDIKSVVIFGHANPTVDHAPFFFNIKDYILNDLSGSVNVLYMNGDAHVWRYEPNFFGQDNFLRIQLTGGTTEPPLQMIVMPEGTYTDSTFLYDRRL
jgi:hypothetical protein